MELKPKQLPHVPELFKQIVRNHNEQGDAIDRMRNADTIVEAQLAWRCLKVLNKEMKEYRRGAEKALKWNKDKGAQG